MDRWRDRSQDKEAKKGCHLQELSGAHRGALPILDLPNPEANEGKGNRSCNICWVVVVSVGFRHFSAVALPLLEVFVGFGFCERRRAGEVIRGSVLHFLIGWLSP